MTQIKWIDRISFTAILLIHLICGIYVLFRVFEKERGTSTMPRQIASPC